MSDPRNLLEPLDELWIDEARRGMGLKRVNLTWAKLEILLGLAAAAAGGKLLLGDGVQAMAGGGLIVLGLYLALAGHRSHLYLSQNRQTAFLLQVLARRDVGPPEPEREGYQDG